MPERENRPRILCWPADTQAILDLEARLAHYGFDLEAAGSLTDLLVALRTGAAALLVDWEWLQRRPDQDREDLARALGDTALVCLSRDGGMAARLQALRYGAQGYVTLPLEGDQLLETLDRLTSRGEEPAGRVLVVDDSSSSAAYYQRALIQAGLQARTLTDPMRLLDSMLELPPDLILMDVYMPGANGEELVRILRQQDAWLGIPILFLSAETDPHKQRQALALGADEFLMKTLAPDLVVSAVKTRLARYRRLRRLMVRDGLTGLLCQNHFRERLGLELSRERRLGKPLSLARLEIDHLQRVNDSHGAATGDRVLRSLARLLRQRLRGSDFVGRYVRDEFAVALPDTPVNEARQLLDQVRETFAGLPQSHQDGVFHCSFSAGLAVPRSDEDSDALLRQAGLALRDACQAGRNRVVVRS